MGNGQWERVSKQWLQPSVEGKFGADVGKNSRMQGGGGVKTLHLLGQKMV